MSTKKQLKKEVQWLRSLVTEWAARAQKAEAEKDQWQEAFGIALRDGNERIGQAEQAEDEMARVQYALGKTLERAEQAEERVKRKDKLWRQAEQECMALETRAEQAEAEMAEWKVQCHRERTKLEQVEAERDALAQAFDALGMKGTKTAAVKTAALATTTKEDS